MIENFWLNAAYSVTPTILIGLVFWFIMRAILHSDRKEREAYSRLEKIERDRRNLELAPHEHSRSARRGELRRDEIPGCAECKQLETASQQTVSDTLCAHGLGNTARVRRREGSKT